MNIAVSQSLRFHIYTYMYIITSYILNCLGKHASKCSSLLKLGRDLFCLQLRIQFGLMNLLDRDQHFPARPRRDVALKLIDLRSLAPDDDARPRSVNDDLQTIRGALDIDVRNSGAGEASFQLSFQLEI